MPAMSTFWRGYRNKPPAIAEGRGSALCYGRHIHGAASAISTTANVASASPKELPGPIMILRQGVAEGFDSAAMLQRQAGGHRRVAGERFEIGGPVRSRPSST